MEYQHNYGSKKQLPPRDRSPSPSRIIYLEASHKDSENRAMCPHCLRPHQASTCEVPSEKKIKRLRSSSKKQPSQGYLEHLA